MERVGDQLEGLHSMTHSGAMRCSTESMTIYITKAQRAYLVRLLRNQLTQEAEALLTKLRGWEVPY